MSLNPVTSMSSALAFGRPQNVIFHSLPAIAALFSTFLTRVHAFTAEVTSEPYGRKILKPEIHYTTGEARDCKVVDKIRELPSPKVADSEKNAAHYSLSEVNGVVTYSSSHYEGSFRGPKETLVANGILSLFKRFPEAAPNIKKEDILSATSLPKIQKTKEHPDPIIEWLRPINCALYESNPHFAPYFQKNPDPFSQGRSLQELLDNTLDSSIWEMSGTSWEEPTLVMGDDNVDAELRQLLKPPNGPLGDRFEMDARAGRVWRREEVTRTLQEILTIREELLIKKFNKKKGRIIQKHVNSVEIPREMIDKYAGGIVTYRGDKSLLGLKRCFHVGRNELADCSVYLKDDDRLASWFFSEPIAGRWEEGYVGDLSDEKSHPESLISQLFSRIFG